MTAENTATLTAKGQGNVPSPTAVSRSGSAELSANVPGEYRVIRRNNKVTAFDRAKIQVAMTKAFLAVEGGNAAASTRIHETVDSLTDRVVKAITRRLSGGGTTHIEDIQDQVELALMRGGEQRVARAYVLYREQRARERAAEQTEQPSANVEQTLHVTRRDGSRFSSWNANIRRGSRVSSGGLPRGCLASRRSTPTAAGWTSASSVQRQGIPRALLRATGVRRNPEVVRLLAHAGGPRATALHLRRGARKRTVSPFARGSCARVSRSGDEEAKRTSDLCHYAPALPR